MKVKNTSLIIIWGLCLWLVGCYPPKVQLLKPTLEGQYLSSPVVIKSPASYDEIWDKLVDNFVQKGLSFTLIDKASGIIIGGKTKIEHPLFTFEADNRPFDPKAFVVSSVCKWKEGRKEKQEFPAYIEAEWNVRIKKVKDSTSINVNLINLQPQFLHTEYNTILKDLIYSYRPTYTRYLYDDNKVIGCTVEVKSTGVFERSTAELFLK